VLGLVVYRFIYDLLRAFRPSCRKKHASHLNAKLGEIRGGDRYKKDDGDDVNHA